MLAARPISTSHLIIERTSQLCVASYQSYNLGLTSIKVSISMLAYLDWICHSHNLQNSSHTAISASPYPTPKPFLITFHLLPSFYHLIHQPLVFMSLLSSATHHTAIETLIMANIFHFSITTVLRIQILSALHPRTLMRSWTSRLYTNLGLSHLTIIILKRVW